MNSDPVRKYLNSFKTKMPNGYGFNINTNTNTNNDSKIYTLQIKNKIRNRNAAVLKFTLFNNSMNLTEGNTMVYNKNGNPVWNNQPNGVMTYRGKGFGAFLRAVATKAGWIAKKNYGTHIGLFTSNLNRKRAMPASTRILAPGWRPTSKSNLAVRSKFNYISQPIGEINKFINNIIKKWSNLT